MLKNNSSTLEGSEKLLSWLFALRAVFNVNVRQLAVNEHQCFLCALWCAMKSSELVGNSRFAFIFEAVVGLKEGMERATRPMKGQKTAKKKGKD